MAFDISKTSYLQGTRWILIIAATIISPAWYLFQFHPKLYNDMVELKLLAICLAIGIPIMIINVLFCTLSFLIRETQEYVQSSEGQHLIYLWASISTIGILYMPVISYWLHESKKPLNSPIKIAIIIQVSAIAYYYIISLLVVLSRRKNKLKTAK